MRNALERGITRFQTFEERDQYRKILEILFEPGSHSDSLRHEAMRLLTLSETPNFAELNEGYNRSLRTRSLSQPTPPVEVDAAPYLASFFDALMAELYADPFFKQQMSDVLKVRAARATMNMERSVTEMLATLRQISKTLEDEYTVEQFEQDVQAYTAHMERSLRYLKLVGVVPKDRGEKNPDPELHGIFVPLRIALQEQRPPQEEKQDSITALLEHNPYLVLLGGPGSGKSTAVRYLAWSHAVANQSSSSVSNIALLSGEPLPLRIELRRLTEDRRHHSDYNFLSYTTEVLLGREGIEIQPQMFKELLERRGMLLLFDGLDEVATLDERKQLTEEIEHFALCYPGNRIIVTSRPVGYELARLSNQWFAHAKVQEFNDKQIRQFLENWYTHVLRLSPIPHDDQQELETLLKTLQENTRLHKLAENPLLLTVITALHRYERLPDRRILVYDRCADLLLETWAKLKGTNVRWKDMKMGKEDQYACVAHLGFVLHKRSQEQEIKSADDTDVDTTRDIASDVTTRFMLREIEHFLEDLITEKAERRAQAKRFLDLMQEEAGLTVERGTDESGESLYGFVHRTFQEYFAAADVYERYQQEEDPEIVSEFLKEHLHDPHWHEVILLLLGKLKRKPVTTQLRQILEGKIKSQRSKHTNIVQQDLFFVYKCLAEEIVVELDFAEEVIAQVGNLVKNSPFPSQCEEALEALGTLMRTQQYGSLGQHKLRVFVTEENVLDIPTKIQVARAFYVNSPDKPDNRQLVFQMLLALVQRPDFSFEQAFQAIEHFNLRSLRNSDEQQLVIQMLLVLAQHSDLSFEQQVQVARMLYLSSKSPKAQKERQLAKQRLLVLAQRPDLSFEQQIQATQALYSGSVWESEEEDFAKQRLLVLAQRPDLSFEQQIQATQALYRSSRYKHSNEDDLATQMLLALYPRPDLSFEHTMQISDLLDEVGIANSQERQLIIQKLFNLFQQADLSFEQKMRIAHFFYWKSYEKSREWEMVSRFLLALIQEPNSTFEQVISASQALLMPLAYPITSYYQMFLEAEQQQAIQQIWQQVQKQDLPTEKRLQIVAVILAAEAVSYSEKIQAVQIVLTLLQSEEANSFLEQHWQPFTFESKVNITDIPTIVKLAKQEQLLPQIRNQMYRKLRDTVPQFDKIDTPGE